MIGLSNLTDGGHVLEHPLGPVYVTVKAGEIIRAELAPWGEPLVIAWRRSPSSRPGVLARLLDSLLEREVMPAERF